MISFGTDGWRAVIADTFTFNNVKVVSQAVADYILQERREADGVIIGYDNRFLSEKFAGTAAEVLASNGIKTCLCPEAVPTPLVSFAVVHKKVFLGIMITASHNPYDYNGYKIKMSSGSSAEPEVTKKIEQKLYLQEPITDLSAKEKIEIYDPKPDYMTYLRKILDFSVFEKAEGISCIVDDLYGSGAGYLTDILTGTSVKVKEINNYRDPLFGGVNPEPLEQNTPQILSMMQKERAWKVGIVLDGDADRIGIIDSTGRFMSAQETFILLLLYIFHYRKLSGAVAKAFNMTRILDHLASKFSFDLIETKIGFKYLAPYLIRKEVVLAGEESGGYGTTLHLPERDGVFNALLILQLIAMSGKTPEVLINEVMQDVGYYYYDRVDMHISDNETKERIMNSLALDPPEMFGQNKVVQKKAYDGIKFMLDNDGWVLFRQSGTESLLRVYAEGRSKENAEEILSSAKKFISRF